MSIPNFVVNKVGVAHRVKSIQRTIKILKIQDRSSELVHFHLVLWTFSPSEQTGEVTLLALEIKTHLARLLIKYRLKVAWIIVQRHDVAAGMLLSTNYTANLISYVTLSQPEAPIKSLAEFHSARDWTFASERGINLIDKWKVSLEVIWVSWHATQIECSIAVNHPSLKWASYSNFHTGHVLVPYLASYK